jgi:hypothetical protein
MLTDQYGFNYYEWPSATWKLAKSIWPFVDVDPSYDNYYKVKIGLKYILYSKLRDVYELYEVTEHTTDRELLPYIKQQRLYLLS